MGEVVNVIVAFAVIIFVFKWATSVGKEVPQENNASSILGFRPKHVTDEMVETIHSMFPNIPPDNIRYDLLRTGNVEITTNKLLERGFLPAPPEPYYRLYPRQPSPTASTAQPQAAQAIPQPQAQAGPSKPKPAPSLIDRYNLQERVKDPAEASAVAALAPEDIAAKSTVWEDSPERREAMLRERKAQMVLAARQRLLAQQQQKDEQSSGPGSL